LNQNRRPHLPQRHYYWPHCRQQNLVLMFQNRRVELMSRHHQNRQQNQLVSQFVLYRHPRRP
jgi:hypothetical protein